MFPEPTELLLTGFSIESIWTPKSKSNTLTPKTNSQTYWQRWNFTRDEWNHLLCLFNNSHFSSTNCLEVMSKRTQEDACEERVTAKSKPMTKLVSRCSERDPDLRASTASESLVKTSMKVNYLWARGMSSNQERWDLWWALVHQTSQNGILTRSGLLKTGNLMKYWKQERRDLWVNNQPVRSLSTQTGLSLMTMIWTLTSPQNKNFR